MTRHRFTFDVTFRHIVDVEVESRTRRVRSRDAATAYLANQLALMDWEDLLCHARESVPVDMTSDEIEAPVWTSGHPAPNAVIVISTTGSGTRGFEFHPDDPVGRYDGFVRLGPPATEVDSRPH